MGLLTEPLVGGLSLYEYSVDDIDWYRLWDDVFIWVYFEGSMLVKGPGVVCISSGGFYWELICRVLEERLANPMYIYCELLGLSVFQADLWVVDSVADFVLGSFWSMCFYLSVLVVISLAFYIYVRVVLYVFVYVLEEEDFLMSDIFAWGW